MNQKDTAAAAVTASLLALFTAAPTASAGDYKTISKSSKAGDQVVEHGVGAFVVKCAGAAKVGENDCGALDGSHPCAGQSTGADYSDDEWVYLSIEDCAEHPNGKFVAQTADGPVLLSKTEFQFKRVVD